MKRDFNFVNNYLKIFVLNLYKLLFFILFFIIFLLYYKSFLDYLFKIKSMKDDFSINIEKSFFGIQTSIKEDNQNNQKDGTKNSSNPEKEYER